MENIQVFKEAIIFETDNNQTITIFSNGQKFKPIKRYNKTYISENDFDKICKELGYIKTSSPPKLEDRR